jgi:hypothetical protein
VARHAADIVLSRQLPSQPTADPCMERTDGDEGRPADSSSAVQKALVEKTLVEKVEAYEGREPVVYIDHHHLSCPVEKQVKTEPGGPLRMILSMRGRTMPASSARSVHLSTVPVDARCALWSNCLRPSEAVRAQGRAPPEGFPIPDAHLRSTQPDLDLGPSRASSVPLSEP